MAYHKNKKHPIPVVGAYVFNKQGKILLIKSKKYKDKYGGPGGHIEFGETIEQALKRELFEETGLLVSNPKLFDIKELINSKEYKKSGAKFIVNPTSNRWVSIGLNHFLYLANNLKKIETVWLNLPIISSGVRDFAGIILPDNQTRLIDYQAGGKNYRVFIGEIKY